LTAVFDDNANPASCESLDPMNTHNDAIIRQIPLQALRTIRLAGTFMSSLYLQFQPFLFPVFGWKADI